jgi:hypothetical protein
MKLTKSKEIKMKLTKSKLKQIIKEEIRSRSIIADPALLTEYGALPPAITDQLQLAIQEPGGLLSQIIFFLEDSDEGTAEKGLIEPIRELKRAIAEISKLR